jgi:hypothetical protein
MNTIWEVLPCGNSSIQVVQIIYYFQNTIYFLVITLTYTDCCLKVLMLKYYNKEIIHWNYFGLYVTHDSFFIWIYEYMIMVPAEPRKYIEILIYIHIKYLHVLANHVAIFRYVNYKSYVHWNYEKYINLSYCNRNMFIFVWMVHVEGFSNLPSCNNRSMKV